MWLQVYNPIMETSYMLLGMSWIVFPACLACVMQEYGISDPHITSLPAWLQLGGLIGCSTSCYCNTWSAGLLVCRDTQQIRVNDDTQVTMQQPEDDESIICPLPKGHFWIYIFEEKLTINKVVCAFWWNILCMYLERNFDHLWVWKNKAVDTLMLKKEEFIKTNFFI
jgi:hypothetical protein